MCSRTLARTSLPPAFAWLASPRLPLPRQVCIRGACKRKTSAATLLLEASAQQGHAMDPFHQVFLDQVRVAIGKEASKDALYDLLRIATPSLAKNDIQNTSSLDQAYKKLVLYIRPDKQPIVGDTKPLFQDVEVFFQSCCDAMKSRKKKADSNSPPNRSSFPPNFSVQAKWPFLNIQQLWPIPLPLSVTDDDLAPLVAAHCVNARGAIAHGQATECSYCMKGYEDVQSAFDAAGGTKELNSIDDIKQELMERGPVVSTSFAPTKSFLSEPQYSDAFLPSRAGREHEILVIGWVHSTFGEFWLVKSLNGLVPPIRIAFGHHGIEDKCLAPASDFDNAPWQNPSTTPHFDLNFGAGKEWMEWAKVKLPLTSFELETFASCFCGGLLNASQMKKPILLRQRNKVARSRRYYLAEITRNKKENRWEVYLVKMYR